ncbi:hypothetical protein [Drosophila suzukii associated hytrosavirus 1]|nr:hypothetical protein [Drosophila suzukii associated hytrosavirus 1]
MKQIIILIIFSTIISAKRNISMHNVYRHLNPTKTSASYYANERDNLHAMNQDIVEPNNVRHMIWSVTRIAQLFLRILYGVEIEDTTLGDDDVLELINILAKEGLVAMDCPNADTIKTVFHRYLLAALRATVEIRFDRELTDKQMDKLRNYFDMERMSYLWQAYDYQTKTCSDADIYDDIPTDIVSQRIEFPKNEREECIDSESADGMDRTRLSGTAAFHFNMSTYDVNDQLIAFSVNVSTGNVQVVYYNNLIYMGYELLGEEGGRQKLRIIYSTVHNNTIVDTKHCYGTDGVRCIIDYSYMEYNQVYYLRNVYEKKLFTGYFIDPLNQKTIQIGSFKTNADAQFEKSIDGFIHLPTLINSCCDIPYMYILATCPFSNNSTCSGAIEEISSECSPHTGLTTTYGKLTLANKLTDVMYIQRGWK